MIKKLEVLETSFGKEIVRAAFAVLYCLGEPDIDGMVQSNQAAINKVDAEELDAAVKEIAAVAEDMRLIYGRKAILLAVCERYGLKIVTPTIQSLMNTGSFDGSDKGNQGGSPDIPYHLENLNTESGLELRKQILDDASDMAKSFFHEGDYDPMRVVDGSLLTDDEWHDRRRLCIGASEVSAVMGTSPFTNNVELWHQKMGDAVVVDETPEEKLKKELIFDWGHGSESYLRKFILSIPEFHDCEVIVETEIFSNEEYPYLTANLDAMLHWPDGRWSILEFKAPSARTKGHYANNNVPEYYYEQIQEQMYLVNIDDAYLVALFDRDTVTVSHVIRDLDFQMEIVQECETFWTESILGKMQPAAKGKNLYETAVRYNGYSDPRQPTVILDSAEYAEKLESAVNLLSEKKMHEKTAKVLEMQIKEIMDKVYMEMGSSAQATCKDASGNFQYVLTRKMTKPSDRLSTTQLLKMKQNNPALYQEITPYLVHSEGSERKEFKKLPVR